MNTARPNTSSGPAEPRADPISPSPHQSVTDGCTACAGRTAAPTGRRPMTAWVTMLKGVDAGAYYVEAMPRTTSTPTSRPTTATEAATLRRRRNQIDLCRGAGPRASSGIPLRSVASPIHRAVPLIRPDCDLALLEAVEYSKGDVTGVEVQRESADLRITRCHRTHLVGELPQPRSLLSTARATYSAANEAKWSCSSVLTTLVASSVS